jgi:hypothetical protein
MKLSRVFATAAVIASMAGPAFSQGAVPQPPPKPPKSHQEIENERAAEQAYKNSLRSIPDKPPADPWGAVRSDDAKANAKPAPVKPRTNTGNTAN